MKIESKLSDQTLYFNELTVRDYKNFLKETFGDDVNEVLFMESVYTLLEKLLNKPSEFVKNLNVIDLLCLLIDIRINSIGDICEISVNTGAEKPLSVQLNMDSMRADLMNINNLLCKTVQADSILINFGCPSLERFASTKDEYISFLKKITVKDKQLDIHTNEQAEMIFNSLNPKTSLEIIETYRGIISLLLDYNLLERYGIFEQKLVFVPTYASFCWLVKLLFSESLEGFYTTFFHMSYTAHMDANYLESITVGEYKYFVSCLKKALAQAKAGEGNEDEEEEQ